MFRQSYNILILLAFLIFAFTPHAVATELHLSNPIFSTPILHQDHPNYLPYAKVKKDIIRVARLLHDSGIQVNMIWYGFVKGEVAIWVTSEEEFQPAAKAIASAAVPVRVCVRTVRKEVGCLD